MKEDNLSSKIINGINSRDISGTEMYVVCVCGGRGGGVSNESITLVSRPLSLPASCQ